MKNIEDESEKKIEIIKMGKFSFELEEKREQSLILQSGYMLTGFSIISVMLLAAIPILLDYTQIPNQIVFTLIGMSLFFLLFSLFSIIVAQWRHKSERIADIESIYELMIDLPTDDFKKWWLENLNRLHKEKNILNDKRSDWMKISTGSFEISIFTIFI